MTEFHQAIAQQVSALCNIPADKVVECVEEPKNLAKADLALVVAKLNKFSKLNGNPAQIASEWASKVQNNIIKRN